ncbi:MAG: hypothetical protein ABF242_04705 [Flavobacteriales bacterium]
MKISVLILALLMFSCGTGTEKREFSVISESEESSQSAINAEESTNSLPSVNFSGNKSIKISISECHFVKSKTMENTFYACSLQNGEVKLLLGSLLSCDYKKGAFIKEITSKPDTFRFEIFQKGSRLSNECHCFFYYEITLKNKSSIPSFIFIGDELFTVNRSQTISEKELLRIKSKLKN